ncbi:MAG: aspartyl/asparaginyl beta-hydroxylase domain-containing protein [Tahibacter sp.]
MRADVLRIPEAIWQAENAEKPNKYGALDRTEHIVFRFVSNAADWRESFERPIWEEWRTRIEPILQQATAPYAYLEGAYPRIMLARMAPGGVIHPHVDANPAARWPHKIHVPLQTNPDVRFFVDPTDYHLEVGQAYEVNNLGLHAVKNAGTTSRIHLIFEYFDPSQPVDS